MAPNQCIQKMKIEITYTLHVYDVNRLANNKLL